MSQQDKEAYEEVGIPLDDLSSAASTSNDDDAETDAEAGPVETQDIAPENESDDGTDAPDEEDHGLPSLFDEEELAEVGLKASPFGDDDEKQVPDEEPVDPSEEALDASEALLEPRQIDELGVDEAAIGDLESELPGFDGAEGFLDLAETPADPPDLDPMPAPGAPGIEDDAAVGPETAEALRARLDALHDQLVRLNSEFAGKLKYDAHKDQIIDKLHQELQEYKQDIVKKHILSIVLDVVKVADDIRKWLAYFRSLDISQRDPVKLFRYLEAIPSDLEDIFYWQGVKPYTHHDGPFNPATQRAIKKIPTGDSTKDKSVARSIRPGYEWEGKVIRQEMVAVYVYEDGNASANTRDIDE